ncbi:MAG: aminotransferase class I/II-fold pyridoxal phosphate-dependent enzyme, partial [Thermoleophilaceae bacterium]|nr:aminotransferase class I/II-fold pyridoxal phosphate-dependent enzyme [Thermoleophilaceae bacterium]
VCVIIDEAYVEFAAVEDRDAMLDVARKHDNVVVLRTFSKVYGLAGVRVGYAFGSPAFKRAVDLVRQPFSVNMVAQAAANAALAQPADMNERVAHTIKEREWVEGQLHGLGLQTAVTRANFSWIDVGERDEDAIVDGLARAGVMVRAGSALGESGRFRVSYGTREENQRFITELAALL